jgi:hypothetical protein
MSDRVPLNCLACQAPYAPKQGGARRAKDGTAKTPPGWRKTADGYRCPTCQAAAYMGRSLRVRILGVADDEPRTLPEMYAALHAASKQSNQFANWYLQQLLAADLAQLAQCRGEKKFPPCPDVPEWYGQATALFAACAPSSLVQQAQMVKRYYSKERFAALAAMVKNVRSYRWDGLPVVVNAQSWRIVRIESGGIALRAQIGPGPSWRLRIWAEGRHLAWLRQIADGEVTPGAAMFVRRARPPRPGESRGKRVWFLRISAQVPRPQRRRGQSLSERTLRLGHDAQSLLYGALDDADDVFEYPAPALRSLIAAHKKLDRQRQIDASYRRQHWSGRKAKRWAAGRTAACQRNSAKVRAELALCAAALVRWCQAHDVTAVDYDVTPRGWMESFPYRALLERLRTSLENAGIYVHVEGQASEPEIVLADNESQPAFTGPKCETEAPA